MAARDRYQNKIKCSKCGEEGVLHISENDYPFMKKFDMQIDSIEGRFGARTLDDNTIEVTCSVCKNRFEI